MTTTRDDVAVLGQGVYGGAEALRLINYREAPRAGSGPVSRQTIARWVRGYDYAIDGGPFIWSRFGGQTILPIRTIVSN